MHCQKFYSSKLIFHSCCEEYKDCVQDITDSYESCEDEEYTSEELINPVKSLSAIIEELEADFACHSCEENAEDISVLEAEFLAALLIMRK
jgi:hypothetical protein